MNPFSIIIENNFLKIMTQFHSLQQIIHGLTEALGSAYCLTKHWHDCQCYTYKIPNQKEILQDWRLKLW